METIDFTKKNIEKLKNSKVIKIEYKNFESDNDTNGEAILYFDNGLKLTLDNIRYYPLIDLDKINSETN